VIELTIAFLLGLVVGAVVLVAALGIIIGGSECHEARKGSKSRHKEHP